MCIYVCIYTLTYKPSLKFSDVVSVFYTEYTDRKHFLAKVGSWKPAKFEEDKRSEYTPWPTARLEDK